MFQIRNFIFLIVSLAILASCSSDQAQAPEDQVEVAKPSRIISLSGLLTEVLFDLGYGESIVGVDITSAYPDQVNDIPKLGHVSKLNAEAIIGLNPEFIFVEEGQMAQAAALKQISKSGIKVIAIPTRDSLYNAVDVMAEIGRHIPIEASAISGAQATLEQDAEELERFLQSQENRPRVLFIYARGAGRLMVGGTNTGASGMIELAGGQNAIQSFEGYQALTPESLVEAAPDAILMFTSGLASLDGKEGLAQIPGIAQTPAFKQNNIIAMDGHYLTSFGPRAGKAAIELAEKIHQN